MKSNNYARLVGYILILGGILILAHNLNFINIDRDLFWGIGLALIGLALLQKYRQNKHLGTMITGTIFLIIGSIILIDTSRLVPDDIIGTLFLWLIAIVFFIVHFRSPQHWWAIIPGGIFFVLGAIVLLDAFALVYSDRLWFVFLFGLSLIFWYLFFIRNAENQLQWAKYPATVLTIFSFFILSTTWDSRIAESLFPLSIIGLGLYLIYTSIKSDNKPADQQDMEKPE